MSLSNTITEVLAIGAILASGAAINMARQAPEAGPAPAPILIYDRAAVADQIAPYTQSGQAPMEIVERAIARATQQGFFVLDAEANFRGPQSATFRLSDFVAPPEGGAAAAPGPDALSLTNSTETRP